MNQEDVTARLRANGGPLALAALQEIEELRDRVWDLTALLVQFMAKADPVMRSVIVEAAERAGIVTRGNATQEGE